MTLIEHLKTTRGHDALLYRPDGTVRSDAEVEAVLRKAKTAQDTNGLPDERAIEMVLATESVWLSNAKRDLSDRDLVDAIHDTEELLQFLTFQMDAYELVKRAKNRRRRNP